MNRAPPQIVAHAAAVAASGTLHRRQRPVPDRWCVVHRARHRVHRCIGLAGCVRRSSPLASSAVAVFRARAGVGARATAFARTTAPLFCSASASLGRALAGKTATRSVGGKREAHIRDISLLAIRVAETARRRAAPEHLVCRSWVAQNSTGIALQGYINDACQKVETH